MGKRGFGIVITSMVVAAFLGWIGLAHASPASATSPGYTFTMESFTVHVGPAPGTDCQVKGELFVPDGVTAANPQPAILTTNGFGGSYTDQVPQAEYFAATLHYVVLTYSGLGFGGSTCQIELDNPAWDGQAASQLVTWLGQQPEVLSDTPTSHRADDPRVGMIGGSYGGAVQLAAASIDPRIDALIPLITWNDLGYSLSPENNAPNFQLTDTPPGVLKYQWISFFTAEGFTEPIQNMVPPAFPGGLTCPGFDPAVCPDLLASAAAGYPTPATLSLLRSSSMVSYGNTVKAPTMLMQGENDTLFNIDEAVANYNQLKANGAPAKLVLQSWGHSNNTKAAPGELAFDANNLGYENVLINAWFDKYLRGDSISTGPNVEYFRDWVPYTGSAQPAYGSSPEWPVGTAQALYLSGAPTPPATSGDLVGSPTDVQAGTQTFVNPPAGAPTSYSETSAVGFSPPFSSIPPSDAPGTFAAWQTGPLATAVDSVGIPTLRFTLATSLPVSGDPSTQPVVFAKVYDIAPDGTKTLADRIVSPTRVSNPGQPLTITLPGVVHRYNAGDRIQLVLASTDSAYIGSRAPQSLSVTSTAANPAVLDLPTITAFQVPTTASSGSAPATVSGASGPAPVASPSETTSAPNETLATTGSSSWSDLWLGAGLVLLGADVVLLSGQRGRRKARG